MRRLLVLLFLVAASFVPTVRPALACSCATFDPRQRLAESDGAFTGSLESREDWRSGSSGDPVQFVFRVEQAVKGDIPGEVIEVYSAASSASCGLGTPVGQRVGVLVDRRDGRWTSSLCNQSDPDALLSAAGPVPEPDGQAPPAIVLGTTYGGGRVTSLDGSGRVVEIGAGEGTTNDLAFCPGGTHFAEQVTRNGESARKWGVALRALDGMEVLWEARLFDDPWVPATTDREPRDRDREPPAYHQRGVADIACRDAAGTELLALLTDEVSDGKDLVGQHGQILLLRRGHAPEVVWEGPAGSGAFAAHGTMAWVSHGDGRRDLTAVTLTDPRKPAARLVTRLPERTETVVPSPDGQRVAAVSTDHPAAATPSPRKLMLVDATATPALVRQASLGDGDAYGEAVWSGDQRVAFVPSWSDHPISVFNDVLEPVASWTGWDGLHRVVATADGVLVRAAQGTVDTAPLGTGPSRRWAQLEAAVPSALAVVPGGAPIGDPAPAPAPSTTTTSPTPPTEPAKTDVAAQPAGAPAGSGRPALAAGAGLALLGAAGATMVRTRRLRFGRS